MTRDRRSTRWALLVVGLVVGPRVAAADPLAQAEAAYSSVDFAETNRSARAALTSGGHDRAQMARIYFLLGVSASADGKEDEAMDAFKHLLSLDPETKLDRGLSPKLQGPMLEARGTPPGALTADAVFDRAKGSLRLSITDPLSMVKAVVLHARLSSDATFVELKVPSLAQVDIPIAGAAGAEHVEYFYQLLDAHKNRVLQKGSDAAPEVFQVATAAPPGGAAPPTKKIATGWLVAGIVGEALGVVGIAGGIGAYVVGKNAADRWNNNSVCLANGMTRSQNCSGSRDTAQRAQSGAIASFALGGALVAAATLLFLTAPRVERERQVASAVSCGAGPGLVGVACGARF
jgi:hypothetical protein